MDTGTNPQDQIPPDQSSDRVASQGESFPQEALLEALLGSSPEVPDRRRIWLWALAGILAIPIVVGLAWVLQDFARRLVVIPASYVVWLFGLFIESTPQFFFWIALLVLSSVLIAKSFSGRPKELDDQPVIRQQAPRRSRMGFWMVQLYHRSEFSRGRLADFVDRLAVDVLSYAYHIPGWLVEKMLVEGEIDAPQELLEVVRARKDALPGRSRQPAPVRFLRETFTRIKRFIRKPISRPISLQTGSSPKRSPKRSDSALYQGNLDHDLEEIIKYLEDQLEIQHDNESI